MNMGDKADMNGSDGGSGNGSSPSIKKPIKNDPNKKRTPDQYTKKFDLNEISPLRTFGSEKEAISGVLIVDNETSSNGGGGGGTSGIITSNGDDVTTNGVNKKDIQQVAVTIDDTINGDIDGGGDSLDAKTFLHKKDRNKLIGTYDTVLNRLEISGKARTPFLLALACCTLLLFIIIAMIAFWPKIPFHMTAPVCVHKECMEASSQILLWANTSVDVCDQPYQWACGKFNDEYTALSSHGVDMTGGGGGGGGGNGGALSDLDLIFSDGEWNVESLYEHQEILKIHSLVAQLPATSPTSAQSKLKRLHSDCMKMDTLVKSQADYTLNIAIEALSGWIYGKDWLPDSWDLKESIVKSHASFGVSPFFKVTIENRNSAPFGNIITISEGNLGLPHKMFYNLDPNHKIINAYKMLIRDFAIHYGTVTEKARKFAEETFFFEKRIVNIIRTERQHGAIMDLNDVQKMASSLPIYETITTIFSKTKFNDKTQIYVKDVELLKEMSRIVSTTDMEPLNNFIIWTLTRHFLPFMSSEYRAALKEFQNVLYGYKSTPPTWYYCSKLLRDRIPYVVDLFHHNPELIMRKPLARSSKFTICKCTTYNENQIFTTTTTPSTESIINVVESVKKFEQIETEQQSILLNEIIINQNNNNDNDLNNNENDKILLKTKQNSSSSMPFLLSPLSFPSKLKLFSKLITLPSEKPQKPKVSFFEEYQMNSGDNGAGSSSTSERLISDGTNYNHELVKIIFYHLRQQFKIAIDNNLAIDLDVTNFINDKIQNLNLQIGIPIEYRKNDINVNAYFADFLVRKPSFIDHLESQWTFIKQKMEVQLMEMNRTEKLIANLYPMFGQQNYDDQFQKHQKLVKYSIDLNTIIITDQAVNKPYFHYRYPIAINFARIGLDISRALIEAAQFIGEQFYAKKQKQLENLTKNKTMQINAKTFSLGDLSCFEKKLANFKTTLPSDVHQQLGEEISASKFVKKSFTDFERMIIEKRPVAEFSDFISYDLFDFNLQKRHPGLRILNNEQLFSLSLMQRHCSRTSSLQQYYGKLKPFIEHQIAERDLFDIAWMQIPQIPESMSCSTPSGSSEMCDSLL